MHSLVHALSIHQCQYWHRLCLIIDIDSGAVEMMIRADSKCNI